LISPITRYKVENKITDDIRWAEIMPVVRKIGEQLLTYWRYDPGDTEAWALQTNIEFFVVNVQYTKLKKSILEAIEYLKKQKAAK
jgi:hypothetical protein